MIVSGMDMPTPRGGRFEDGFIEAIADRIGVARAQGRTVAVSGAHARISEALRAACAGEAFAAIDLGIEMVNGQPRCPARDPYHPLIASDIDWLAVLDPPSRYGAVLKLLSGYLDFGGEALFPCLARVRCEATPFRRPPPLLLLVAPHVGMQRVLPVLTAILTWHGWEPRNIPILSQVHPRVRDLNRRGDAPSLDANNAFYREQARGLTSFEFAIVHETVDPQVFADLPELRVVQVVRDPRAMLNTAFHRLKVSRFRGADGSDVERLYPDDPNRAFAALIDGGVRHNGVNYASLWPALSDLVDHFIAGAELANVAQFRYEDARLDPLPAYRALIAALDLRQPPIPALPDGELARMIEAGTFAHQTGGRVREGAFDAFPNLPQSSIRNGMIDDWRRYIPEPQQTRIAGIIGPALDRLGYATDGET